MKRRVVINEKPNQEVRERKKVGLHCLRSMLRERGIAIFLRDPSLSLE
jgi:hypothetical protein